VPLFRLEPELVFPDPNLAEPEGLLAVGGDLDPRRLLLAYSNGIFPWYNRGEPILWWCPPERAVVAPAEVHIGRTMRKALKKAGFCVRVDTVFEQVIRHCAKTPRPGQRGTWITPEMMRAYMQLHEEGYAHSFETFLGDELVGGLYGVSLGGSFFGESMFSRVDDASKAAFVTLARTLASWDFDLIDCQLQNENVQRYGTKVIPRRMFLELLSLSLQKPTRKGRWFLPEEAE
jgi:leucyl/phenylalanyl-tRNA--protein transferase